MSTDAKTPSPASREQDGEENNRGHYPDDTLYELHDAVKRQFPAVFTFVDMFPDCVGYLSEAIGYDVDYVDPGEPVQPVLEFGLSRHGEFKENHEYKSRYYAAGLREELHRGKVLIPV